MACVHLSLIFPHAMSVLPACAQPVFVAHTVLTCGLAGHSLGVFFLGVSAAVVYSHVAR